MKRLALAIAAGLCLQAARAAPPPGRRATGEVRALWVVRTSITSEAAVEKLVADAKAAGINTLLVQVRGRGDAFYRSRLEPRSAYLKDAPESFDPLASVLAKAHAARITVHAWINTHLLCDLSDLPTNPSHVFRRHPEWLAVPRRVAAELAGLDPQDPRYRERIVQASRHDAADLEGIFTDPANPAVQDHLVAIFRDVAGNYDVDGVHFDFVRYPNPDFSYSRTALERFRAFAETRVSGEDRRTGAALVNRRLLRYVDSHPEAWDRFRREQITELVARVAAVVRAIKPRILVSAAVFANEDDAFHNRFQDWKTWLERGLLDVVCPMAYTPDTELWKRQIAAARASSFGRQVWAGIGAYRQPPASALEKIRAARRMGVDGLVFFSYGHMVSSSEWAPAGDYLQRIARGAFRQKPLEYDRPGAGQ